MTDWWVLLLANVLAFVVPFSVGWAIARGEWPWTSWRKRRQS